MEGKQIFRKILILTLFFALLFTLLHFGKSSTQETFYLDLKNPVFNFTETQLNDSKTTKDLIFSGNENITVYIKIPKNSTILYSNISLRGQMTPIQSSAIEEIFSLAIGNVTTSPENEIAIAAASYIFLLNVSSYQIWNYSIPGVEVYDVAIGNISSDEGNEIVGGAGNSKIYVLNSSGNLKFEKVLGGVAYSVAVGDVNSSIPYDEIAVGAGDSKIYLFDHQGNQIWNFSTGAAVNGLAIGNISSDEGNEIVGGSSDYKLYVLNSSGNLKFEKVLGEIIKDVAVGDVNSSIPYDEIAVALNNGTVILLDHDGNVLWQYTTTPGTPIDTVAIGEVTDEYNGKEVVLGSNDKNVYVISSSGQFIWSFSAGDWVRGVDIGNLTADPGNEVVAGTRKTLTTINLYILNFEYYPTNPWLDIGNDSVTDWSYSGKFRSEDYASNNSAFQDYLKTCSPDYSGACDVPLVFHSDFAGDLNITSISVKYQYNISDIISFEIVSAWSRTDNIWVNESVGNQTINITYLKNPAVTVKFDKIKVNSTATKCDFDGITYSVSDGVCGPFQNVTISSEKYDWVWDDTMPTDKPVLMSESEGVFEGGFWKKNLTIWNTTPANITNVIANVTLNESVTGYSTLKVEWYNNGTLYNITPATNSTNCNSLTQFSSIKIGNDTFLVCMQDLDNNGVVDYFVWKQPFTKGYTRYEVSGSANHLPILSNITVTPSQGIWGTEFNISVNVSDAEGDNVTVRLYVNFTKTFNLTEVNFSQIVWQFVDEKNTTQNTTEGEVLIFNLTSTKEMTGNNLFRLSFRDFNSSTLSYYHDEYFTSINYGPNVTKHNVSLTHIQGNDTSVNRTETALLVVQVNDLELEENASGVNCTFWVWLNDTHKDWGYLTQSDSNGYCNYSFTPNGSYVPGQRKWNVTIEDRYYNLNFSQDYIINIYGKLNLNITQETISLNATRNVTKVLTAKLFDEFGKSVEIANYNCSWYINESFKDTTKTNESGYCNYSWKTNCSDSLGVYIINVTLSGNENQYYLLNKTEDAKNIFLKGILNLTIISPQPNEIYISNDTVYLNSSIQDYCGFLPEYQYNASWTYNLTNPYVSPPPSDTLFGDNITLQLSNFPPGILNISLAVKGELYNFAMKNVSVWVYGRSGVNVIYPKDGGIYEYEKIGEQDLRTLNISCFVFNFDTTPNGLGDYYIEIWNNSYRIANGTTLDQDASKAGWFNYTWNISGFPDGEYKITCNITNYTIPSPPENYMRYVAIKPNSSVSIIIRSIDTQPPEILSISVNSTTPGNNVTIEARIRDWYGVNASWINLTYPNGTNRIIHLMNTTPYLINTIWKVELSGLNQVGDYDFILYANDSSANVSLKPCIEDINHTACKFAWFEIYLPIQLYINSTYDIDFTFYRPGTNLIVHSFKNETGYYNYTLHKRTYDFEAKLVDRYGQKHSIKFNSFNSTATAQAQNSTNITNPLKLSDIDVRWVRVRPNYDDRHLAVLKVDSNMIYSNVTILLNYSKSLEGVRYEGDIRIFKCSDWNETSISCLSGWQELGDLPNLITHVISTTQNSTSVYAAVEKGGALLLEPGGGVTTGGGETGGRTGGAGYTGYCGNGICDLGEDPESCPQDCGPSFVVKTNLTEVYLFPKEIKRYQLFISNRLNKDITLSIQASGAAKGLMSFKEEKVAIKASSNASIPIDVIAPEDAGTYTGIIAVEGAGHREELQVTINVLKKEYMPSLQISLEVLSKSVEKGGKLNLKVSYDTKLKKSINTNLIYSVLNISRDVVYEISRQKVLEGSSMFLDSIDLPEQLPIGRYYLKLTANYDGESVSSIDFFDISAVFLTPERIKQIFIAASAILFSVGVIYGRKSYKKWKALKARYIFPVDPASLPKGNLWLGKIAETNIKMNFDMNDLVTHVLIAGATGSGKSVTGNIFVEELLDHKIPVVVFDPTGQWTGFMRPCTDPKVLKYYKMHGLSPRDARFYPGNIIEITDPNVKIDLRKYMNPGEITVFLLSKLKPGDYDKAIINLVDSIFQQGWEESTELKLVVVFDEVHRLLERYGGTGGYIALERACREFRKWGIGLIMISQVLNDFKEAIKGNVLTEIQMHTKSLSDLQRIERKYGLEYAKRVAKEEVGIGMMQNPKYNKGVPWFISFRPPLHMPHKLPSEELEKYKLFNEEVEKIKLAIEKLERAGKDVSDLKIDLKLATDKIKEGRFRMAEIYIESLKSKLGV